VALANAAGNASVLAADLTAHNFKPECGDPPARS